MVRLQNEKGNISISKEVFSNLVGAAATNCFGVKGMAIRSMSDGLVHLLKRESMGKGVYITYNEDGSLSIDLHIIIEQGVNILALCSSIMSEVSYKVEIATGAEVKDINIYIDSIIMD